MESNFAEFTWYCAWIAAVLAGVWVGAGTTIIIIGLTQPGYKITIGARYWLGWAALLISIAYIIAFWN